MRTLALAEFLTATLVLLASNVQAQECTLNHHPVIPECVEGFGCNPETGILICTQGGKPFGEWQMVQGKHVGFEKKYDDEGGHTEQNLDENGKIDGVSRRYSRQDVLLSEEKYSHEKLNGKSHVYFPDGKQKSISWWDNDKEIFDVEYTQKGDILDLMCGKQHYMDEDIALCGFDGKPETITLTVIFYGTKDVTYLNGVLINTVYHPR
jgi:hypothetical protein